MGSQKDDDQLSGLTQARDEILSEIHRLVAVRRAPILVALDGGSGAGKSTLASLLARETHAVLVPLDDFFAAAIPDAQWDARSTQERGRDVFDWPRVRREALEPLLAGKPATWYPFDFAGGKRDDGTYGVSAEPVKREPAPVIVLEGAYSAHPNLADLIDLAVLVDVPVDERHRRLATREEAGFLEQWHARWDAVEADYFRRVRPRSWYDLVVTTA